MDRRAVETVAPAAADVRAGPYRGRVLLKRDGRDADALFELLERGAMRIALAVEAEQADVRALMHRYRGRPMSLADACLVRL